MSRGRRHHGRALRRRYGRAAAKNPVKRASALEKKASSQITQAHRINTRIGKMQRTRGALDTKIAALDEKEKTLVNEAGANRALAATLRRSAA